LGQNWKGGGEGSRGVTSCPKDGSVSGQFRLIDMEINTPPNRGKIQNLNSNKGRAAYAL